MIHNVYKQYESRLLKCRKLITDWAFTAAKRRKILPNQQYDQLKTIDMYYTTIAFFFAQATVQYLMVDESTVHNVDPKKCLYRVNHVAITLKKNSPSSLYAVLFNAYERLHLIHCTHFNTLCSTWNAVNRKLIELFSQIDRIL